MSQITFECEMMIWGLKAVVTAADLRVEVTADDGSLWCLNEIPLTSVYAGYAWRWHTGVSDVIINNVSPMPFARAMGGIWREVGPSCPGLLGFHPDEMQSNLILLLCICLSFLVWFMVRTLSWIKFDRGPTTSVAWQYHPALDTLHETLHYTRHSINLPQSFICRWRWNVIQASCHERVNMYIRRGIGAVNVLQVKHTLLGPGPRSYWSLKSGNLEWAHVHMSKWPHDNSAPQNMK